MMRLYLATLVIVAAIQALPPVQPKQPIIENSKNGAVSTQAKQTKQGETSPTQAISRPIATPQPETQENTNQRSSDDKTYAVKIVSQPAQPHDLWLIGSTIATVILAAVGVFTVIILWRQTNKIGEQVTQMIEAGKQTVQLIAETKKSADAAFQNSIAIVNAERAWIHITFSGDDVLKITNHGKTPGRILNYQFSVNTLPADSEVRPEDLAGPLNTKWINTFIGSNEEKPLERLDVWKYFGDSWKEITNGHRLGFFQVIVHYKHIVMDDEMRESRAVYLFDRNRGIYDKLPKYTNYT